MPRKNWRIYGGRKEGGGFEIGVEVISDAIQLPAVPAEKTIVSKQENPFKGVKNISSKHEAIARSLAVVLINDITDSMPRGSVNVDSLIEMENQGPSVNEAVDRLKRSGVTSLQAAKFAWKTLQVAGQNVDPAYKHNLIQSSKIRFGETRKK